MDGKNIFNLWLLLNRILRYNIHYKCNPKVNGGSSKVEEDSIVQSRAESCSQISGQIIRDGSATIQSFILEEVIPSAPKKEDDLLEKHHSVISPGGPHVYPTLPEQPTKRLCNEKDCKQPRLSSEVLSDLRYF